MNPFRDALELHPRPSLRLTVFLLAVHVAAFTILALVAVRQPWAWLPAPVLALSLAHGWRRVRLTAPGTVVRLLWRPDGTWRWESTGGHSQVGRLLPSSVSLPSLVLLHLRPKGGRTVAVPLAPDSVGDAARFRRLRARLKLQGPDPA